MTDEKSPADVLNELRVDIDRIDAAMHELLIERGGIIERLIAVKARQGGGSAFRPGREAEMMRRLAERHRGALPLDTVESIWRVIISTFTFVQAAYSVHAVMAAGDGAMRDSARFHFGFTVPLVPHSDAGGVIDAVARAEGDLGMIPLTAQALGAAWWLGLEAADAPKIIARLPFIERGDHPAGQPVFVIARPSAAAAVRDVVLFAISPASRDGASRGLASWTGEPLEAWGATILSRADAASGAGLLVSVPAREAAAFAERVEAHPDGLTAREVGSHAARFAFGSAPAS